MARLGLLRNDSRRGFWEITDEGKRWLEESMKETRTKMTS